MIGAILGEFWPFLLAGAGVVAAWLGGNRVGRSNERKEQELRDANDYIETSERIGGVDYSGDDTDWLRDRAKK